MPPCSDAHKAPGFARCLHLQGSHPGGLGGRTVIMVPSTASNPQPGHGRGGRTPSGHGRGQEACGGRSNAGRPAQQGQQLQVGPRKPSYPCYGAANGLGHSCALGCMPPSLKRAAIVRSAVSEVLLLSCVCLRGSASTLPVLPIRALAAAGYSLVLRGGTLCHGPMSHGGQPDDLDLLPRTADCQTDAPWPACAP